MAKLLLWLSILFFTLALVGVAALWLSDARHDLIPMLNHQQIGALPLILIGLAYISFQLSGERRFTERAKGLLLGLAFLLWGGEQLLPPSVWVTAMDSAVITIFVVDLVLIIIEHIKRKDHELP
jgi:hypothetical protein